MKKMNSNMKTAIMKSPSEPSYTDNVYGRLMSLEVGQEIEYDPAKGSLDDWQKFLTAAKRFIDETRDHPLFPTSILISSSYTRLKKSA